MSGPVAIRNFSAKFAGDLIAYAGRQGADEGALLALLAVPTALLGREDIRVPAAKMAAVWLAAMEQCRDPMIATRMGQQAFSAQQTTNLIMQSSVSVQEAFALAVDYSELISNVMVASMDADDANFYLAFETTAAWGLAPAPVVRDCLQIAMLSAARTIGQLTGTPEPPAVVHFALPAPRFSSALYEMFDCPIHFNAPRHAIGFRKDLREVRLAGKDPGLQAAIRDYADELRRTYANGGGWTDKVRAVMIEAMPKPVGLGDAARRLNVSQRSLQRRLRAEQTTYRRIGEEVRLTFAERYLGQASRSLDEVAYLSGYHDAPTMIRAYKRKFGRAPRR